MNRRWVALEFITRCLSVSQDPDNAKAVRAAINSQSLDWDIVLEIAETQKMAPTIWASLRNKGFVKDLPPNICGDLFKQHLLNTIRNKGLREQAIEAICQLNALGITPILLKGGASLFVDTFIDAGSRVMSDLDILIPKESASDCWNHLINTLGYSPIEDNPYFFIDYRTHHHLRPLARPNSYGTIELHHSALPNSAARILATSLIWRESKLVPNSLGLLVRIPSPTHRVLHNILHADLINKTYAQARISLRSLHELVTMQTVYGKDIDWQLIEKLMSEGDRSQIPRASLYLAHRLFGSPIPDCMRPTRGTVAHYFQARFQVDWRWLDRFVERMLWFSNTNIRERYQCKDDFWSITKGRFRLATSLALRQSHRLFQSAPD
ncbi:MAG: nucleotidyltransferase family protein [Candidatus Competibacteraceae bacterium]|nr:nucleotidyltransferase family protein [Candidatus Competibacteraceae bacterium]